MWLEDPKVTLMVAVGALIVGATVIATGLLALSSAFPV